MVCQYSGAVVDLPQTVLVSMLNKLLTQYGGEVNGSQLTKQEIKTYVASQDTTTISINGYNFVVDKGESSLIEVSSSSSTHSASPSADSSDKSSISKKINYLALLVLMTLAFVCMGFPLRGLKW